MAIITSFIGGGWRLFNRVCENLAPVGDLVIRYWVAKVFFMSALTKIQSWDSTIMLFTYEYHVPLLSPTIAAYSGATV